MPTVEREITVLAPPRDFKIPAIDRDFTVKAAARQFTMKAASRDLEYPDGIWYTQDYTAWTTWGQTNIRVFHAGYTKTFGDLP